MDLLEAQKHMLAQLNKLDELKKNATQQIYFFQQQRAIWHDKFIKKKKFEVGYLTLLFDFRYKDFKEKLTTRWLGPYEIKWVFDNGAMKIKTIDDRQVSFLVSGNMMQLYHKPLTQEEFMNQVSQ